jgi:hypothetical protein
LPAADAALDHPGQHEARELHRDVEVHREHVGELFGGVVDVATVVLDARIVHEHVDRTCGRLHALDEARHPPHVGEIGVDGDRTPTALLDLLAGALEALETARDGDDDRAALGEGPGDERTDAPGGTGHQRDSAAERVHGARDSTGAARTASTRSAARPRGRVGGRKRLLAGLVDPSLALAPCSLGCILRGRVDPAPFVQPALRAGAEVLSAVGDGPA